MNSKTAVVFITKDDTMSNFYYDYEPGINSLNKGCKWNLDPHINVSVGAVTNVSPNPTPWKLFYYIGHNAGNGNFLWDAPSGGYLTQAYTTLSPCDYNFVFVNGCNSASSTCTGLLLSAFHSVTTTPTTPFAGVGWDWLTIHGLTMHGGNAFFANSAAGKTVAQSVEAANLVNDATWNALPFQQRDNIRHDRPDSSPHLVAFGPNSSGMKLATISAGSGGGGGGAP